MIKSIGLPPRMRGMDFAKANGPECPGCGAMNSRVMDSRPMDGSMKRRRVCLDCEGRFTTYEISPHIHKFLKGDLVQAMGEAKAASEALLKLLETLNGMVSVDGDQG